MKKRINIITSGGMAVVISAPTGKELATNVTINSINP
jgi:hypothetical protein